MQHLLAICKFKLELQSKIRATDRQTNRRKDRRVEVFLELLALVATKNIFYIIDAFKSL